MKIKTLNRKKAKEKYDEINKNNFEYISYDDLDDDYKKIRNDLISFSNNELDKYEYDLDLALKIYEYFNELEDFNVLVASNYEFWYYICLKVVPDLIYVRHFDTKIGTCPDSYYYSKNVRVYIPTLWWYIHMTWQGSYEKTKTCLEGLNTDFILQIVERPGRDGIYLDISREIIKQLSNHKNSKSNDSKSLLRRVMIQNTARINNYNLVFDGKIQEYVASLFKACGEEI